MQLLVGDHGGRCYTLRRAMGQRDRAPLAAHESGEHPRRPRSPAERRQPRRGRARAQELRPGQARGRGTSVVGGSASKRWARDGPGGRTRARAAARPQGGRRPRRRHDPLAICALRCVGSTWTCGTTSREVEGRPRLDPAELGREVARRSEAGRVAIVFGQERRGLSDAELALCHAVCAIPTSPAYDSMNLAQAAAVLTWEVASAGAAAGPAPGRARGPGAARDARSALGSRASAPRGRGVPESPEPGAGARGAEAAPRPRRAHAARGRAVRRRRARARAGAA